MGSKLHAVDQSTLSYSGWIRGEILRKPDLTFEELATLTEKQRPKDKASKQMLYNQRNAILRRYGLKTLADLPYKANGELHLTEFVRLYLKAHGTDVGEPVARAYFAGDNIAIHPVMYFAQRKQVQNGPGAVRVPKEPKPSKNDSPDQNQHSGPRAGKPVRQRRRRTSKPKDSIGAVEYALLIRAKELIDAIGGCENARKVIDFIESVRVLP